jgi:dTDP-glucose 4,6-dehydratase
MRTILVTGGCGFIGSNFVRLMLEEYSDIKVVNVDALTYAGNLGNLADVLDDERHVFAHGSICDGAFMQGLLNEHSVEGVINFAAESHVDRSITGPGVFIDTNVSGTLVLLQAARAAGVSRFLQVSTDEVYGSLGAEGLFTEDSQIQPNSPYSASKASADHLVRAFHHTYGMDTVITRCSNNYGPYQFPEKMMPLMINNARYDKSLPVYGDGMQVRDWLYVRDHCTAIWAAYEKGGAGEVYNIGGNSEKTNISVVKEILRQLGKSESLITYVTDRPGHDRRYAIDASKAKDELG